MSEIFIFSPISPSLEGVSVCTAFVLQSTVDYLLQRILTQVEEHHQTLYSTYHTLDVIRETCSLYQRIVNFIISRELIYVEKEKEDQLVLLNRAYAPGYSYRIYEENILTSQGSSIVAVFAKNATLSLRNLRTGERRTIEVANQLTIHLKDSAARDYVLHLDIHDSPAFVNTFKLANYY